MTSSSGLGGTPAHHTGAQYYELMADISRKRSTKIYLEIGVNTGTHLQHIHADLAVCVDPEFRLCENICKTKKRLNLYQMTSDAFFADQMAIASVGGAFDLAFLDGMHNFEFLLRDFYNTEKLCHETGLIAMHDCMPLNAEMAHRHGDTAMRLGQGTNHPNFWTGDVWKIVPILQKYRPDLRIVCVDAHPTGVVFVTNLKPQNTHLKDIYLDIVDDFRSVPNDIEQIEKFYNSIEVVKAGDVMNEYDYSLYFNS